MTVNITRYLKNTSGAAKIILGTEVADNAFYLIAPEKWSTISNSDSIITDITNGDLSVSFDGVDIIDGVSNQINALKGYTETPSDTDGTPLARIKITTSGWHYQMYGIEFETGTLNSIVDLNADGTAGNACSIKYFKSNGDELTSGTQLELDLYCVKTVVYFEPLWDYEIIGGQFRQLSIPQQDIRLNVIAVPDVPTQYGGSVPFVNNINLRYIGNSDRIQTDGRTSKRLLYDATNHTNKLAFIVNHGIFFNHKMQLMLEIFRS